MTNLTAETRRRGENRYCRCSFSDYLGCFRSVLSVVRFAYSYFGQFPCDSDLSCFRFCVRARMMDAPR